MKKMRVIDFFCGAGGFSEGFRQAGFQIVMGIDNWEPAIRTHNLNHGLKDVPKSVLDYEDIKNINDLPNTEIMIGSPPCVSFSHSNKGGNSDKSLGIRLIEAYLRVIAVKKHQPNSILKAWLMENVPNSRNYVKEYYTFDDLQLADWAVSIDKNPSDIALNVKHKGAIMKASDYGAPQARNRFVCGELTETGIFPLPNKSNKALTLLDILSSLPAPLDKPSKEKDFSDPNYPSLMMTEAELTDHYYDTGVYEIEWRRAQSAKQNHPYMGPMSFPENLNKPSRTIMATKSMGSRESLLYESEKKRIGNGQYRIPTVREAACLMGFPISYNFYGSLSLKWRQIGNSVCPQLSASLANKIREELSLAPHKPKFNKLKNIDDTFKFLDDYKENTFTKPPKKNPNTLFRAHPVKTGNMTVAVTNRYPDSNKKWVAAAFVGTGKGYKGVLIEKSHYDDALHITRKLNPAFIKLINQDNHIRFYNEDELDLMNRSYNYNNEKIEHPHSIVRRVEQYIKVALEKETDLIIDTTHTSLSGIKSKMPLSQIMAVSALGSLVNE